MLRNRSTSRFETVCALGLIAALAWPAAPVARAAESAIDLDGNPLNGAESRVVTRVLQTYPVRIENVVYNNATGESFTFFWPGAGPGGFDSFVTMGPSVGTKWEWTTVSQVYSIQSPVTFRQDSRGLPSFGGTSGGIQAGGTTPSSFSVPGKSIYPTTATVSSASLTSSLVTFFSPEKEIASCGGTFSPGRFEQTITNNSPESLTVTVEQPDCCPEPQMIICEDGCQFYRTDPQNCGGCGIECASDEFCDAGTCAPICPGQLLCGETCVDSATDPLNCGGCGVQCAADEYCSAGACTPICPAGQLLCGETCVDPATDPLNCGGCGIQCGSDEFCDAGTCASICPAGQTLCGSTCVDLSSDPAHCGACGVSCAADEYCGAGTCQPICPGQTLCGATCADLQSDPLNCGACGNVCGSNDICTGGACVTCRPPTPTACGNVCTNTRTDGYNCGGCGNVCDFSGCPSGGTGTCSQGTSCICDTGEIVAGASTAFAPAPRSPSSLRERPRPAAPSRAAALEPRRRASVRTTATTTAGAVAGSTVEEAPVCDVEPVQQTVAPGASFTQCLGGSLVGKEVFTIATVQMDGKTIGQGPCALIVPASPDEVPPASLAGVFLQDASGDGLCQPGEACDLFVSVQNLTEAPLANVIGRLASPPDAFNPLELAFSNDTAAYPDFPAFAGAGDCENPPELDPQQNLLGFSFRLPAEQEPDVGRVFHLELRDQGGTGAPLSLPVVIGIGRACDPASDLDGETYDGLEGLLDPVNATLLPEGGPVRYSSGGFTRTNTIPLKLRLRCGSQTIAPQGIDPNPEIVALIHESLGPQPLLNINGENGANPSDPFFSCGTSRCEYQLRTRDLPVGTYVINLRMPDSRVFQAGFTVLP